MLRSFHSVCWIAAMATSLAICASASGYSITKTYSVSFSSDTLPDGLMAVDTFDTNMGTLTDVMVKLFHSGAVTAKADNDDALNSAEVMARMVRSWNLSGPDLDPLTANDYRIISSPTEALGPDDGDGGNVAVLDPTTPDGYDFGMLTYNAAAGEFHPNISLYETNGLGTVTFSVSPVLMVNDLAFVGSAPDVWQLEVQDPDMTVTAEVTYTYVPEPATASLLLFAIPFLLRTRRRHLG